MLKDNSDKVSTLRGLLSTMKTVNEILTCKGDCGDCILEKEEDQCIGSKISSLANEIDEMEGV